MSKLSFWNTPLEKLLKKHNPFSRLDELEARDIQPSLTAETLSEITPDAGEIYVENIYNINNEVIAVPGGVDTSVQYNVGGTAFGGDAYFTYNATKKAPSAYNFISNLVSIPTLGTNTILSSSGSRIIEFTGALAQTVTLPDVTTLTAGHQFEIINNSANIITVNSSGGNGIYGVSPTMSLKLTCVLVTGTTAASWSWEKPVEAEYADTAGLLMGVGDIGADTTTWPLLSVVASGGSYTPATSSLLTYNAFAGAMTTNSFIANTSFLPDANDGAALGTTALQFSDLFLAEGAVINFDNGDVTITQTGNALAIAGGATIVDTLGVGTTTATEKVTLGMADVFGSQKVQFLVDTTDVAFMEADRHTATGKLTNLYLGTMGSRRLVVTNAGKVGIGTTTPGASLAVAGLTDYANNAAAVTGGLAAGDFYTETGTNPKRVCVVY